MSRNLAGGWRGVNWLDEPIVTDRLTLRQVENADVATLADLWSRPESVAHGGAITASQIRERSHGFVHKPGKFLVTLTSTTAVAGLISLDGDFASLFRHDRPASGGSLPSDTRELSFVFFQSHWGHGYAREGVEAVSAWTFANVASRYARRLLSVTGESNFRSRRLLETLGWAQLPADPLQPTKTVTYGLDRPVPARG